MKKTFIMLIILGLAAFLAASQGSIKLGNFPTTAELTRSSGDGLSVRYSIEKLDYQEVQTKEGVFTDLSVDQYTSTNNTGLPRLPLMPDHQRSGAQVVPSFTNLLRKSFILADEGVNYPFFTPESVSKSADLTKIPFEVNRFYAAMPGPPTPRQRDRILCAVTTVRSRFCARALQPPGRNRGDLQRRVQVQFINPDIATDELRPTYSPAFEGPCARANRTPRMSLNRYPISYLIITLPTS